MHPAQNKATPITGVVTSRVSPKCTKARSTVNNATEKALHSSKVWVKLPRIA